jgi:nitroimidazol reductase NimA-like FMN-containing flavoprotein (pyridoxamine 5'-phosphate oxidase superfamily)
MSYKLNQSDLEYTLLNGTYLVLGLLNLDKEVETIPMMYVWDKEKTLYISILPVKRMLLNISKRM